MMQLLPKTNIDFIGKRFVFFGISGFFLLASAISLAVKGLNLGLDFTGGTLVQVQFAAPTDIKTVRQALADNGVEADIQSYTGNNAYAIRVKGMQEKVNETGDKIKTALSTGIPGTAYTVEKMDFVGPAVGRDLSKKALWAMVLSLFGIIIYVAFRFNNPLWGAMGVAALFHDVFIAMGFLSVFGIEVDLVIVAALLTIAGFSINDTIVIFDRMRENMRINIRMPLKDLINTSINETISRTVITNLTVLTAVLILFVAGGAVIHGFAFTMLVGAIAGTYSTIAIATPLVFQFSGQGAKRPASEDKSAATGGAKKLSRKTR